MKIVFRRTIFQDFVVSIAMLSFLCAPAAGEKREDSTRASNTDKGEIRLESGVSVSEMTIGDLFTFDLTIVFDEGYRVESPPVGTTLGDFEIKDYRMLDPVKNQEGHIVQKHEYQLTTFTTGMYTIPPIPVSYTDPEGHAGSLQSRPVEIMVKSVLTEDAEDIRDIKKPADIKPGYRSLIILIFGVLLAALLLAGFFYWRRKRKQRPAIPVVEVQLPPHEVALSAIDALLKEGLLVQGKFKVFYIRFAEIFLTYLTGRFNIATLEKTTSEILTAFHGTTRDGVDVTRIRDILKACDLVKFAKYMPPRGEAERTVEEARFFIQESIMKEAAASGGTDENNGRVSGEETRIIDIPAEGGTR